MAQATALFVVEKVKMKVRLADLVIEIKNKYEYVEELCREYLTDAPCVDFFVECTDDEIEAERQDGEAEMPKGYLESLAVYRKICTRALDYDAFLVHSAVIELEGNAYAFLAKSGTGKSTHIALWRTTIGDKVKIINGDKPIYRYIDGILYAYGTPWCGKEGWQRNTRARLKALCYIERAEKNSIEKITPRESVMRMLKQVLIPKDADEVSKTLALVDRMLNDIQSWIIKCNISSEAALIAYNALKE